MGEDGASVQLADRALLGDKVRFDHGRPGLPLLLVHS